MTGDDRIRKILESKSTLDRLAAIEHERWASWQQYVHDHGEQQPDGSLIVPADLVSHWNTQIKTPYSELSEQEQESDRKQVRKYLPTIIDELTR